MKKNGIKKRNANIQNSKFGLRLLRQLRVPPRPFQWWTMTRPEFHNLPYCQTLVVIVTTDTR